MYTDYLQLYIFYELILQLKPVFLLFLCSVSVMYSSFQSLCATPISSSEISKNPF